MSITYVLISVISFFISLIISYKAIPFVDKIGNYFNILDYPNQRKNHKKPIVRIGGLAIYISFFISALIGFYLIKFSGLQQNVNVGLIVLISTSLFIFLGLSEDIKTLSPRTKLFFHLLFSILTIIFGLFIGEFHKVVFDLIFFQINIPYFLVITLGTIWIVGMTNAFNWIDGIDGLASINSIIIILAVCLLNLHNLNFFLFILCLSCIGSLIGFYNFNKPPAKIFMGDCGSFFLGSLISISALLSFNNQLEGNSIFSIYPIILFFIFSWPLLDLLSVFTLRLKNNISPFHPDRNHLHHRLLRSNFDNQQIITISSYVNILCSSIALISINYKLGIFFLFFSSLLSYLLNHKMIRT